MIAWRYGIALFVFTREISSGNSISLRAHVLFSIYFIYQRRHLKHHHPRKHFQNSLSKHTTSIGKCIEFQP